MNFLVHEEFFFFLSVWEERRENMIIIHEIQENVSPAFVYNSWAAAIRAADTLTYVFHFHSTFFMQNTCPRRHSSFVYFSLVVLSPHRFPGGGGGGVIIRRLSPTPYIHFPPPLLLHNRIVCSSRGTKETQ
jgi:hypothetical protein